MKRTDSKSSGRKRAIAGVLLVFFLLCGFLLSHLRKSPPFPEPDHGAPQVSKKPVNTDRSAGTLTPLPTHQEKSSTEMDSEPDRDMPVQLSKEKEGSQPLPGAPAAADPPIAKPAPEPNQEKGKQAAARGQASEVNAGLKASPLESSRDELPAPENMAGSTGEVLGSSEWKDGRVSSTGNLPQAAIMDSQPVSGTGITPDPGPPVAEMPPEKTITDPFTENDFGLVKGGCFQMGSEIGDSDERPVHEVCLDDFYMGRYEVSQAQYEEIMGHNPSAYGGADRPVESVSWEEVQAFIRQLNRISGKRYRLPSEAEWEYAARGGQGESAESGDGSAGHAYAHLYQQTSYPGYSAREDRRKQQVNRLGLHGFTGNVWEWVADWYGKNYYAVSPRTNPPGPQSGLYRSIRAGGPYEWLFSNRFGAAPDEKFDYLGFRLAISAGH